jgi:hypothetical protein
MVNAITSVEPADTDPNWRSHPNAAKDAQTNRSSVKLDDKIPSIRSHSQEIVVFGCDRR